MYKWGAQVAGPSTVAPQVCAIVSCLMRFCPLDLRIVCPVKTTGQLSINSYSSGKPAVKLWHSLVLDFVSALTVRHEIFEDYRLVTKHLSMAGVLDRFTNMHTYYTFKVYQKSDQRKKNPVNGSVWRRLEIKESLDLQRTPENKSFSIFN